MERRTAAARAPIPASKNLTLLDLTDATCKFETHGGTVEQYRFCGHPTEADEPYCLGHCWLAYNAPSRTAGTRKAAA